MRLKNVLGSFVVAIIIYMGLFSSLYAGDLSELLMDTVPAIAWVKLMLFGGIWGLLYRRWLDAEKGSQKAFGKPALFIGAACTLCMLLDHCFLRYDYIPLASLGECVGFLWTWASGAALLSCALQLLATRRKAVAFAAPSEAQPQRLFWLAFAILLLCWLPYIIVQFPGHIETTAGQQIRQGFGQEPISGDNPVFHTLLMKLVVKGSLRLGFSDTMAVFMLSLTQILLLAIALAWSVKIVGALCGKPWAIGLLAFYCICPLFALYGLFIVKDVPFAAAVLLCTCEIAEIVQDPNAFQKKAGCIRFLLIACFLCLMRNLAAAILCVVAVALLIYRRDRQFQRRLLALSLTTLALVGAFQLLSKPVLQVETFSNRQAENRSLQCQMIARVVREHEGELSQDDLATIDRVLPIDGMGERYDPEVSDPIKDTWRVGVTREEKLALDALTAKYLFAYPLDCLQAMMRMGLPYLTPGDTGRFRSIFDCGFSDIDAIAAVFHPKHLFSSAVFRKPLDFFQQTPLINLFCSGGLYAWLLLGCLIAVRKNKGMRICFIPAMTVLLGCLLSPVAGYVRYALPYMFSTPILFALTLREGQPKA